MRHISVLAVGTITAHSSLGVDLLRANTKASSDDGAVDEPMTMLAAAVETGSGQEVSN